MKKDFIEEIEASDDIINALGRFSLLWNAFECELFDQQCTVSKIRNFENYNRIKKESYYTNLINTLLNYLGTDKRRITREIIKNRLYSVDRNEYQIEVEQVLKNDMHGEELQIGTLLILLRLRNNMFHGLKDCYQINSQLELFIAANSLLNYIMMNF